MTMTRKTDVPPSFSKQGSSDDKHHKTCRTDSVSVTRYVTTRRHVFVEVTSSKSAFLPEKLSSNKAYTVSSLLTLWAVAAAEAAAASPVEGTGDPSSSSSLASSAESCGENDLWLDECDSRDG